MLKQTTGEPIISLGTMRRTSWTHGNMLTAAIYFWCRAGLLYLYIVLYSSSGILGGAHFPRLKSVVCIVVPGVEFNFFKLIFLNLNASMSWEVRRVSRYAWNRQVAGSWLAATCRQWFHVRWLLPVKDCDIRHTIVINPNFTPNLARPTTISQPASHSHPYQRPVRSTAGIPLASHQLSHSVDLVTNHPFLVN